MHPIRTSSELVALDINSYLEILLFISYTFLHKQINNLIFFCPRSYVAKISPKYTY